MSASSGPPNSFLFSEITECRSAIFIKIYWRFISIDREVSARERIELLLDQIRPRLQRSLGLISPTIHSHVTIFSSGTEELEATRSRFAKLVVRNLIPFRSPSTRASSTRGGHRTSTAVSLLVNSPHHTRRHFCTGAGTWAQRVQSRYCPDKRSRHGTRLRLSTGASIADFSPIPFRGSPMFAHLLTGSLALDLISQGNPTKVINTH